MSNTRADEPTLARLRESAATHNVELDVRVEVHTDDLVDLLLTTADEVDASVIVIGLRHRTTVGKPLMGSNAHRILLQTKRPVLAVKA